MTHTNTHTHTHTHTHTKTGRVIISGSDGILVDSKALLFTKGILTTPSIRINKLLSDMDVRGNTLRNAVLVNAKIESVRVGELVRFCVCCLCLSVCV